MKNVDKVLKKGNKYIVYFTNGKKPLILHKRYAKLIFKR